jgi:peptide/nickel transport system substrate-binding protein
MLRDRIDMLYEVGVDALDSMNSATNVSVYTFRRRYQYEVVFNVKAPVLRSPEIRRALNMAIDRDAMIRDALDGHALPSFGLVWPQHWALGTNAPGFLHDPKAAAAVLSGAKKLRFTCLVPPDYERLALVVKQQLELVGVEVALQIEDPNRIFELIAAGNFEAVLFDVLSGQSPFRLYRWWHTGGSMNPGHLGSPPLDAALDRVRRAASDDQYRAAIAALQKTVVDDPPAIFLAWSERARAVSSRFIVPDTEPGRDILSTLYLWKLNTSERPVARVN